MRRKFLIKAIKERFECQRCGLCCKAPGYVFLTAKDIGQISRRLKLTQESFLSQYCTKAQGSHVLKAHEDGSCIFLKDFGCEIHEVKPKQCRDFPRLWREPDAFDYCEGIKKLAEEETSIA